MQKIRQLKYPVLVIGKKTSKWIKFEIVEGPSRYFTYSRLPLKDEYEQGWIFDSASRICDFEGMSAWPQLENNSWTKMLLESLLLPAMIFRACALFLNLGPRIGNSKEVELAVYKSEMLHRLKVHNSEEQIGNLSTLLENGYGKQKPATDAKSVLKWVDAWITDRSLKLVNHDDADDDHPGLNAN